MVKVYKDRQGNFTHIKNDIFESDKYDHTHTLSWKAIGIFAYMWHQPDDWDFYEDELATHVKDGKSGLRTGIKELEATGFLTRKWHRDAGRFSSFDWILNEAPFTDFPQSMITKMDKSSSERPPSKNRPLLSTNDTKDGVKQISSSQCATRETPQSDQQLGAIAQYEQLWGFPNAIARQDLLTWINTYSDALVSYAIEIAGRNNVRPSGAYKYLDKILTTWSQQQITTVADAKKQNQAHQHRQSRYCQTFRNHPTHQTQKGMDISDYLDF
jgi:DnaD/phage-associated family protein